MVQFFADICVFDLLLFCLLLCCRYEVELFHTLPIIFFQIELGITHFEKPSVGYMLCPSVCWFASCKLTEPLNLGSISVSVSQHRDYVCLFVLLSCVGC